MGEGEKQVRHLRVVSNIIYYLGHAEALGGLARRLRFRSSLIGCGVCVSQSYRIEILTSDSPKAVLQSYTDIPVNCDILQRIKCCFVRSIIQRSRYNVRQNNKEAAISTFPPAMSKVLIASSLDTPKFIKVVIASSECVADGACPVGALEAAAGAGEDPRV